ncbi:MAG: NYN domain-containing protein [Chloroflexi bacterium]|nr:NYN domain-containing protein [Chloroflexota bacterium]
MTIAPLLTDVFIDGMNLYNGALKGTTYKWLDVRRLAETVLSEHPIGRVYYFTAPIQGRPPDYAQPIKQGAHLRALATLKDLEIHLGTFSQRPSFQPLAEGWPNHIVKIRVMDVEEKQSDVNLATYAVASAIKGECEQVAIISNDADFAGLMRYLRDSIGIPIIVLNPNVVRRQGINRELRRASTYIRDIKVTDLAQSQLPHQLTDQHGIITKPESW